MGNLCINDYSNVSDHTFKCIKCNDTVNIYKNNTRKHCRIHRLHDNGICGDCKVNTRQKNTNCHHIKKNKWYPSMFT